MVGRQVAAGAAYRVAAPQIGTVDGGSQRQVLARYGLLQHEGDCRGI